MIANIQRYTLDDFDEFVQLPENTDRRFEYLYGDVVESVSNSYCSYIAMRIARWVMNRVAGNKLGYVRVHWHSDLQPHEAK
jgi:Uma2 family endonuclease